MLTLTARLKIIARIREKLVALEPRLIALLEQIIVVHHTIGLNFRAYTSSHYIGLFYEDMVRELCLLFS